MTQASKIGKGGVAALKNVAHCYLAYDRIRNRPAGRPGFAVFNGPSGFGKTFAAIYVQNKTGAARVEIGDSWSRKTLIERIGAELRVDTRGTLAQLVDRVVGALVDGDKGLLIDEADKAVDKGMIELIREVQEHSGAPVMLIGEEKLPAKLEAIERVHNRVAVWEQAQPCDLEDAQVLADHLSPITIEPDLLCLIVDKAAGRARRIVVNIDNVAEWARNRGLDRVSADVYDGPFFVGSGPKVRGFA